MSGPTKTQYEIGDELDLTGLVVTAHYSDGSEAAVAVSYTHLDVYKRQFQGCPLLPLLPEYFLAEDFQNTDAGS